MKKLILIFVAITITIPNWSCRTHEKCPAYGQKKMQKEIKQVLDHPVQHLFF